MKQFRTWLTTIAVLLCSITTSAYDFEVDGIYYTIKDVANSTVGVSSGDNKYTGTITIPEKVSYENIEFTVTSIESSAFSGCSTLERIDIPQSVVSIKGSAFDGCSSLTSITIPESVTSVGYYVFDGCDKLSEITLNASVSFSSAISLDDFIASGPIGIKSLFIGKNVRNIQISPNINYPLSSIECLVVDEENPQYDSRDNCNAIIETETNKLIFGCYTAIIPNTVTSIGGESGFSYNLKLASMIIPNSVKEIGFGAFQQSSLSEIFIPSSITNIYPATFNNCSELKTIICDAVTPPTVISPGTYGLPEQAGAFYGVPKDECILYVPEESIEAYKAADTWKDFTNIQAMVRNVEISDNTESFTQSEDAECARITYTRTFNNTNWQALYVPFDIPVTEEFLADFEVAYINDARQYDHDEDGKKDETVIEGFKIKTGTLEANYPYLIRAREIGAKTITATDAMLYAAEENYIDCSSVFETYTFTGTYKRMSSDELSGYYSLSGGVWRPIAEGASLGAFRFYLKVDSRNGNTAPAQAIRMRIIGDGETTDIDELESIDNTEQPTIIYDLQGRRIENTENLKGVYVVNGRKVVF